MKKTPSLTYAFINPNSFSSSEEALKHILLEKLLAEFTCSQHPYDSN
jgi:hypothetical protein